MADGFIVRKGGVTTEQTATPSILDFSTASATSIKFKLRNNDSVAATLVYRFGTLTGDGESISVAANTTTGEITFTVPTITTPTSLFVTANATGKVKSEVAEQEFAVPVIYTAATGGTTLEYDDGGSRYKSHTFTSNGTFEVTTAGNGNRNQVDYLIIAGGGSAGGSGGGGGAGGYKTTITPTPGDVSPDTKPTVSVTSYSVTVGGGGAAISSGDGNKGTDSSVAFSSTITAEGGGASESESLDRNGLNGGSGGGGGAIGSATTTGGTGVTGQGFAGGGNAGFGGTPFPAGGGGGASEVGKNATSNSVAGGGGNGLANTLRDNSSETRSGGGGGGLFGSFGTVGSGGTGGGGNGGRNGINPTAGAANTGGGGGGCLLSSNSNTVAGGSGLVIIRYEIAPSV